MAPLITPKRRFAQLVLVFLIFLALAFVAGAILRQETTFFKPAVLFPDYDLVSPSDPTPPPADVA